MSDLGAPLIQRAIVLRPDAAIYHNNLGEAQRAMGELDKAALAYQRAIALRPDYADAQMNLGAALGARGMLEKGLAQMDKAAALRPEHSDTQLNRGNILQKLGRLDEAAEAFTRAIELDPASSRGHNNLGIILAELGRAAEARECYRKALELDPDYTAAHDNLLLALHYDVGDDGPRVFEEHLRWAERPMQHENPKASVGSFLSERSALNTQHSSRARPKLRIGYISPDFCRHPVGHFMQPLIEHHDRNRFHILCYGDIVRGDDLTQTFAAQADTWRNIAGMGDDAVAELVRRDEVDILVDLAGHTAGNRLGVFARRPAPAQMTYLGYPNTTGLRAIDWRISDIQCDPDGDAMHTERLLRLKRCFLCYRPPADAPAIAPAPIASNSAITFASFNNFAKVSPATISLWIELLTRVPGSRLLLKAKALSSPSARERLISAFTSRGIDAGRVEMLPQCPSFHEHLSAYGRVDIAVDTYPYCGTTTTCEALWMGVPVITLAGPTHVTRVGGSLLHAIGLPELIAKTREEYVGIAAKLAGDMARLSELRRTMRERMARSELCDERGFVRAVEGVMGESVDERDGMRSRAELSS